MSANVIPFTEAYRSRPIDDPARLASGAEPCMVIILPVLRVDRGDLNPPPDAPEPPTERRRRAF